VIYEPMLAQPLDYERDRDGNPTFSEPQWQWDAEPKLDGIRCVLYLSQQSIHNHALTRVRGKHTGKYADKAAHIPWLDFPMWEAVLDGELTWGKNSRETMEILGCHPTEAWNRQALHGDVHFTAFDLLKVGEQDHRFYTYEQRRESLLMLVSEMSHPRIHAIEQWSARMLWARITRDKGEGIMLKAPMHQYQVGRRSTDWMKAKRFRKFIAVVTGFQWGKKGKTGQMEGLMGSLSVSMLNKDGILIHVGDVGTGFAMAERSPGAWPMRTVVEVESSDVTEDLQLWHPVFRHRRPDLRIEDAKYEQILS